MAYELVTFLDLQNSIRETLGIQVGDSVALNKIKRVINEVYLDEVVPFDNWKWLRAKKDLTVAPYISTGTVSVTEDSATVTLSSAPTNSVAGYWFSVEGQNEIYEISAHTAATTTVTLTAPYTGDTDTGLSYRIWTNSTSLPADCAETIQIKHDFRSEPLEAVGVQKMGQISALYPKQEARPDYYTTLDDTESTRAILIYPAVYPDRQTLHLEYLKTVEALDLDADEPLIPVRDRIVIKYGALSRLWASLGRNPEEAASNDGLYQRKLTKMSGKLEDSVDYPQMKVSKIYMARKRGAIRPMWRSTPESDE
jgi:hypothetical protein